MFVGKLINISVGGDQYLVQVDKDMNNKITTKKLLGVRFVPLASRVCFILIFIIS